jgi:hypothetical protein
MAVFWDVAKCCVAEVSEQLTVSVIRVMIEALRC